MFDHGIYGIRVGDGLTLDEVRNVHYWIRTTGKKSRKGIDGGRIDLLRLTINGEMTAEDFAEAARQMTAAQELLENLEGANLTFIADVNGEEVAA